MLFTSFVSWWFFLFFRGTREIWKQHTKKYGKIFLIKTFALCELKTLKYKKKRTENVLNLFSHLFQSGYKSTPVAMKGIWQYSKLWLMFSHAPGAKFLKCFSPCQMCKFISKLLAFLFFVAGSFGFYLLCVSNQRWLKSELNN